MLGNGSDKAVELDIVQEFALGRELALGMAKHMGLVKREWARGHRLVEEGGDKGWEEELEWAWGKGLALQDKVNMSGEGAAESGLETEKGLALQCTSS